MLLPILRQPALRLIIFDKDGTLIDFHYMWATWLTALAQQLETAARLPIAAQLYHAMDFDPQMQHIAPRGRLALWPIADLRQLAGDVLRQAGMHDGEVERILAAHWQAPDPIALARPLADLAPLFSALRACGIAIAIATSDDRAPTETLLRTLGLSAFVSAIVCADDHLPIKPAADMIALLCGQLSIAPAQAMVIGDSVDDMQMGRAAGVGMTVGVLSGLSTAELLAPYADAIIPSVAHLLPCAC